MSFLNSTELPIMVEIVTFCNLHIYHTVEAWNFYCIIIILEPETSEQPTAADTRLPDERSKRHEERKKQVNVLFTVQYRGDVSLYFRSHVYFLNKPF